MQIAAVYGVLLLIALVLFWLTRHRKGGVSLEQTSFSRWLSRGMSALTKSQLSTPVSSSSGVTDFSLSETSDLDSAVAVLQDIYAEFQQDSAGIRADFSTALETLHHELRAEMASLNMQVAELQTEVRKLQTEVRELQTKAAESSIAETANPAFQPSPLLHVQSDASADSRDNQWLILTALQEGMTDEEIAVRYPVSLTEIELVRHLLLAGQITAEKPLHK